MSMPGERRTRIERTFPTKPSNVLWYLQIQTQVQTQIQTQIQIQRKNTKESKLHVNAMGSKNGDRENIADQTKQGILVFANTNTNTNTYTKE